MDTSKMKYCGHLHERSFSSYSGSIFYDKKIGTWHLIHHRMGHIASGDIGEMELKYNTKFVSQSYWN